MQLRRYGFSFLKIRDIFISHIHGDHLFGIYGLLSTMSMIGRTADLNIYAPHSFSAVLKCFLKHFGSMFNYRVNHIVVKGAEPEKILETKSIEILSFPLNHRIDCYGFLFREKMPKRNVFKHLIEPNNLSLYEIARLKEGEDIFREGGEWLRNDILTYLPFTPRSFAYCSDTAPFDNLVSYVKGVNLIYHETTFASDMEKMARDTMHSTAKDAAECARDAGASHLLIGHFSSRYKNKSVFLEEARKVFCKTEIAEEGTEIEIPLNKFRT